MVKVKKRNFAMLVHVTHNEDLQHGNSSAVELQFPEGGSLQ